MKLHECIKRQMHNFRLIKVMQPTNTGTASADDRFFANKAKLAFLCFENIQRLRAMNRPKDENDLKIIDFCRDFVKKHAYSIAQQDLIDELEKVQKGMVKFSTKELRNLKVFVLCTIFDAVASDVSDDAEQRKRLAMKMLNGLENIDFQSVFETVSPVEKLLMSDPANVYAKCDLATKELYRSKLSSEARKRKIAEYELANRYLKLAENSSGKNAHIGYHILKNSERHSPTMYFLIPDVASVLVSLPVLAFAYKVGLFYVLFLTFATYLVVRQTTKKLFDDFASHYVMQSLPPRLDLKNIPSSAKTLVAYTVSLQGKTLDKHLFDKILLYARAYNDQNLSFCVLADLPDSKTEKAPEDREIIDYAMNRMDEIRSFNPGSFFAYRKRTYCESEEAYIGHERKRGAQNELINLLSDDGTSLFFYGGEKPENIQYLLALDADSEIAYEDILRLVATASHPCNAPEFANIEGTEIVTDGYGVFVPTAVLSLKNISERSKYSILKNAFEGRKSYENAIFSVYTALSDEGVFCGKGLIDISAYKRVVSGKFPRGCILSHDIAEGTFLRAAAVADATVFDSPPKSFISEQKRLHRWIRGDFQSVCLVRKYITDCDGKKYKNPLPTHRKMLIFEPVKSHLASALKAPALVFALVMGGKIGFWMYLLLISDLIYNAVKHISTAHKLPKRSYDGGSPDFKQASGFALFTGFASVAADSCLAVDAAARAFYRSNFSHKHLLEWSVSSVTDQIEDAKHKIIASLKTSVLFGMLSITVALRLTGTAEFLLLLHAISWVIYPFCIAELNVSFSKPLERKHQSEMRYDALKMWRFFSENVNRNSGFLPPDNISFFPEKKTIFRTSPTNIGLYLLSTLNAFDFGFIDSDELFRRLTDTLNAVLSLERSNGHLYNWYDIQNMCAIPPLYISTVDSGNLAVSLLTVKNGIKCFDALCAEPIKLIDRILDDMDFTFLYDKHRNLFHIGYYVSAGRLDPNFYDLYPSEMLSVSFYAVAKKQVPTEHFAALGRIFSDKDGLPSMLSWSGTAFEYFMPALWLPFEPITERGEMLFSAAKRQKLKNAVFEGEKIYGISESGYFNFDKKSNYSYKANGVSELAISTETGESVYSPYSLYLMLAIDSDAAETLVNLKKTSLYGEYGFYEAVDMVTHRVGNEAAIIRQYMAHHVGMSIASTANHCLDNINIKRFTEDPNIAASEYLLYEKNEICRPRADEKLNRLFFADNKKNY